MQRSVGRIWRVGVLVWGVATMGERQAWAQETAPPAEAKAEEPAKPAPWSPVEAAGVADPLKSWGLEIHGLLATNYTFNFNDGSDDVVQNSPVLVHTFNQAGLYDVKLVVTDSRGKVSSNTAHALVEVQQVGLPSAAPERNHRRGERRSWSPRAGTRRGTCRRAVAVAAGAEHQGDSGQSD